MNKVIVNIHGGLGNQLFQFAFAYSLKTAYPNINLYFDLSFYLQSNNKYPRDFMLDQFIAMEHLPQCTNQNLQPNLVTRIYKSLKYRGIISKLPHSIKRNLYYLNSSYGNLLQEQFTLGYNPIIQRRMFRIEPSDVVLDGYWPDIRYFEKILPDIKKTIKLKSRNFIFDKLVNEINSLDVMIHIRRGDYLKIGSDNEGIFIGIDYYTKAIELLLQRNRANLYSKYWVFSDDYDWCKQTLKLFFPDLNFVYDPEKLSDAESFELMRNFKNIICANSTYSLWAAYLNCHNENVEIYYPQAWVDNYLKLGFRLVPTQANWNKI